MAEWKKILTAVPTNTLRAGISVVYDNGSTVLPLNVPVFFVMPFDWAIANFEWVLIGTPSGSMTVKIFDCGSSSAFTYNSTTEITPTGGISISSATIAYGSGNGWSLSGVLARKDIIRFEVTACTTITRATVTILPVRT